MIDVIKTALLALVRYLELKSVSFYYDINEKSRKKQSDIRDEIEELRKSTSSNDHDRADLLRTMLQEERDYINHLSTHYSLSGKR